MKRENLLQYFFYVFLFGLPFQMVYFLREPFVDGVKWEYGVVGVYGIDILLFLLLVLWGVSKVRGRIWNQESGIKIPPLADSVGMTSCILIVFVVWAGLSIVWAGDQALASYFFIKLLLGAGLFFVARSMEIDMKKIVFVLLLAGVIQSGIGIAQFLSQQSIDSSILGMSTHEAYQAGSSVLKIDSGRFLRAYGTFPHPNVLGGFLGAILMLCIAYFVLCISYRARQYIQGFVLLGGMVILLLGLILTFSRVAWGGVGIAIFAYYVFCIRYQVWEIQIRFLKVMVALLLAGSVFGFILSEQIFPRFDGATIKREGSISERVVSLRDAKALISEHWMGGVGAGNFTAEILQEEKGLKGNEWGQGGGIEGEEREEKGLNGEIGRPVWEIQPAHNVFLLVWAELGIVGLVLFVGFLMSVFVPILKSSIINHQSAILIALIPSLFLDHFLWTSHFGLFFLFLLLGLVSRR